MEVVMHNLGARLKLVVQNKVQVKGKYSYVVRYRNIQTRVPLYDWQIDQPMPKELLCRLKAINDFGFPLFEQVATEHELELIEPVRPKIKKVEHDGKLNPFFDRYSFIAKKKNEKSNSVEVTIPSKKVVKIPSKKQNIVEEHNVTFYMWSFQEDCFEDWFITTGGIKRRFQILLSLAETLAEYHRKNKVYKDLVPEYINIKVEDDGTLQVVLPQTNYTYSGVGNVFVYASHGAPEVVNRRMPNTPMSDCYSFAIIAYELLNFCHPFIGDKIKEDLSLTEEAFKGKFSWIDSKRDSENQLTRRYWDRMFVTDEVFEQFKQTFDEGKDDPMARPSIFEWIDEIQHSMSLLRYCPNCKSDYLYMQDGCCAFCDMEPDFSINVAIYHFDKMFNMELCTFSETDMELYPEPVGELLVNSDNLQTITNRQLLTLDIEEKDILNVKVYDKDDEDNVNVVVEPLNGYSFIASTIRKERFSNGVDRMTKVSFSKKNERVLMLSLQELDTPQRVVIIKLNKN